MRTPLNIVIELARHIVLPKVLLDPLVDTQEAIDLARHVVIEAERQIQGIQKGHERLDAVTEVLIQCLVLPKENPRDFAKLFAKTVYFHIAEHVPDHLRMSKTQPPAPERS